MRRRVNPSATEPLSTGYTMKIGSQTSCPTRYLRSSTAEPPKPTFYVRFRTSTACAIVFVHRDAEREPFS